MIPYDNRQCMLGEGPLWHPQRGELFWFDILNRCLHTKSQTWDLPELASAAGWIDGATILIATETRLAKLDLNSGDLRTVIPLEADRPENRSNDGRADPWGGFWIGTMGKSAEPDAGQIYRYFQGSLRPVVPQITIPNAICFAPDRSCAYFSDSAAAKIWRLALDAQGWPDGIPVLFRDLTDEDGGPDGAVTAADGTLWNAQWGGHRVAQYSPQGHFLASHQLPPRHTSCPAFGGPDLTTLFVTSAQEHIPSDILAAEPENGQTFALPNLGPGLPEPQILL